MERHQLTAGQIQKESQIAAIRQAEALEHLVVLAEAIAKKMGVTVPERRPAPIQDASPKEESFNPFTEKAPGVPLEGQEAEEPKKVEKYHASKSAQV